MKIAVTTASGHLGGAIINHLKEETGSNNVIGIARTPEKAKNLGIEVRKGDYNSKADFLQALKGVDAVILVSGMDHPDKRIQQHRNVIEAAKENGVKKIVYTSIMGAEKGTGFSSVVASNRQTEEDIKASGMKWAIGRNGIYIEPDLEYIDTYKKEGGIFNSAGEGKCGYTSRPELAYAYFKMVSCDEFNGRTFNLYGEAITQQQLADALNKAYGTNLIYKSLTVREYTQQRVEALGEFLGTVIGGIYEGINTGVYRDESDFPTVAGRAHKKVDEMIKTYLK